LLKALGVDLGYKRFHWSELGGKIERRFVLNLIEALKSGKRIRRTSWTTRDYYPIDDGRVNLPIEAIIANDWEVEEPSATITLSQFYEAWNAAVDIGLPNNLRARDLIAKGLGL
jgi:hypothetical protein